MSSMTELKDKAFPFEAVERAFPLHFLPRDGDFNHKLDSYTPTLESFAECCGVSIQAVYKWRREGYINGWTADRIAVANNMHPSTLWPSEWAAFLEADVKEPDAELVREQTRIRTANWRARQAI